VVPTGVAACGIFRWAERRRAPAVVHTADPVTEGARATVQPVLALAFRKPGPEPLSLVHFVAVPAAPMPYARATCIQRRKGTIRMSDGCTSSQLRAEPSGVGRVLWITNEPYRREKHGDDDR
jgi:hypothetical protein